MCVCVCTCAFVRVHTHTQAERAILYGVVIGHLFELYYIQGKTVLVYWGCCNKLPQDGWLQTLEMYSLAHRSETRT